MPMQNMPTHNLNSQAMIENFKSMALTMLMVKSSNGSTTSDSSSFINTIIMMLVISFIDSISLQIKQLFSILMSKFQSYVTKQTKKISIVNKLTTDTIVKTKMSSIIIKIEPVTVSRNPTSDAIIELLTNFPHTKCIIFQNGSYHINYNEEIEIHKSLFAKIVTNKQFKPTMVYKINDTPNDNLKNEHNTDDITSSLTTDSNINNNNVVTEGQSGNETDKNEYIELYSYTLNMEALRNEVNDIVKNYLIRMNNKLGNNIYYFTELPTFGFDKKDNSRKLETLHFRMKHFTTNRSFSNLFGNEINIIRKRVEFFKNNKDWYDNKGVPYTLGIMVSGQPGSGKTSVIKCIANELKRHIINVHLSDNMTKLQLENLFYNEQLHVTQDGKTETYTIPINKRVYVLEDVDCQCDVILDRNDENPKVKLMNENETLKKEIERLNSIINQLSTSNKPIIVGNSLVKSENNNKSSTETDNITLSFLLNLFDGVLETPGRIVIMTTNFIDKLDKAFTRPGRIDICCKFGFATHNQIIEILEHRYDVKLTNEQVQFIYNILPYITPAEIGRILFENFDSLEGALNGLLEYSNYMSKKIEREKQLAIENGDGDVPNDDNNVVNCEDNDDNNNDDDNNDVVAFDNFNNSYSTF